MPNKTRLSGSVKQFITEMTRQGKIETLNYLAERKVCIIGNGKDIKLKTDENGVYEIYGLPPGKYKVMLDKISGFSFTNDKSNEVEVEIKSKSHTEENIFYSINNAIRGKLYDSGNKPVEDVLLKLIPANEEFPKFYIAETYTNKDGDFEFENIPIGTFLLVVNKEVDIGSETESSKTLYYPGTFKREEASEITIGAGVFYENFNLKLLEHF